MTRWVCFVASALLLGACAQGNDAMPDAKVYLDAPVDISLADTPPLTTLSQTTSNMIEPNTSAACNAMPSGTAATNYYRVFDLAALGITTDFHVYRVEFQVEHCHQFSASDGCDATVRVGTYAGALGGETLTLADMVILESTNVHVPEVIQTLDPPSTPGGTVTATFDTVVPAGAKLLVEIDTPNGSSDFGLYLGANNDGETAPAYALAPSCMVSTPMNISSIAMRPVHLLLTVSGVY